MRQVLAALGLSACVPQVYVHPPQAPVGSESEPLEPGELELGGGTGLTPYILSESPYVLPWPDWDAGWLRAGLGVGLSERLTLRTGLARTTQGWTTSSSLTAIALRRGGWRVSPVLSLTGAYAEGNAVVHEDSDGDGDEEFILGETYAYAYLSGAGSAGVWAAWRAREWLTVSLLLRGTLGRTLPVVGLGDGYRKQTALLEGGVWTTFGNPRGLTVSVGLHELWPRRTGLRAPQLTVGATWRWRPGVRRALPQQLPPEPDWRLVETDDAWPVEP